MKTSGRTLRTQRLVPMATTAALAQMMMVSPPVPPISAKSVRVGVRWSASHSDEIGVSGVDAALQPVRDQPAQAEHHDEDGGPDEDDLPGHGGVLPPTRATHPPLAHTLVGLAVSASGNHTKRGALRHADQTRVRIDCWRGGDGSATDQTLNLNSTTSPSCMT